MLAQVSYISQRADAFHMPLERAGFRVCQVLVVRAETRTASVKAMGPPMGAYGRPHSLSCVKTTLDYFDIQANGGQLAVTRITQAGIC
jgi:hypothetical protein